MTEPVRLHLNPGPDGVLHVYTDDDGFVPPFTTDAARCIVEFHSSYMNSGPKCGCGHLIRTHLADGACLGCTGTCDSGPFVLPVPPRKRATPDERAAIRTLRGQIAEDLARGIISGPSDE